MRRCILYQMGKMSRQSLRILIPRKQTGCQPVLKSWIEYWAGGIVAGSLVLVGGDPGIGKSTLLLQMCKNLSHMDKNVLYISGEESLKQIKMRAERIGTFTDKLLLLCETNLDIIEETMKKTMPDVVIIDSIQTMYREDVSSAPAVSVR